MEPDVKELLKKNLELTKENNKLLRKARRGALLGGLFKLVWVVIIIGVTIYAYFNFISPILDKVLNTTRTVQEVGNKVGNLEGKIQKKLQGGEFEKIRNFFNIK